MNAALREKKLLELLKHESEFVTVQYLSNTFEVSKRTIHNDLLKLEAQGFQFEKKPGTGIRLNHSDSSYSSKHSDEFSPEIRRQQLMKELLFEEKTITYQAVADRFMVSMSSVIADINLIRNEILTDSSAKLIGDESGTRFQGTEAQWQRTMITYSEYLLRHAGFTFHEKAGRDLLSKFYDPEYVDSCYKMVMSLKKHNIYYVADYYLSNVFLILTTMTQRLSNNHHHTMLHEQFHSDQVMNLMYYTIAKDLLEATTKDRSFTFDINDIYFLSMYLKGNRVTFKTADNRREIHFEKTVQNIILRMSKCTNVDLADDPELYESLYMHLIPMIHRLQNKIFIKNPMLEEIKTDYRLMLELTWLVTTPLMEELGITMTEDEAGFLMLYFQSALEKKKKSKRIIVVCPNGIATSNLIANRIRQVLPPLDIIEVASLEEMETFEHSGIELIVSTVPVNIKDVPVLIVSQLITSRDLEKLQSIYNCKFLEEKNETETILPENMEEYLKPEHIFFHKGACTQDEIIETVCNKLYQDDMVDQGFLTSIIEREKMGGTDNKIGGAIPHGAVNTVKKTCFALWVNDEPIKWTRYKVKVIVFFALSEKDMKQTKKILEKGFFMIKSKEIIEYLSSVSSKKELTNYLFGGINYDQKRFDRN